VPDSEGDGRYSYSRPWELTSQTLEMQRRQQADAAPPWYPSIVPTPDAPQPGLPGAREMVRANMVPPEFGYRTEELGISDILDGIGSRLQGSPVRDNALLDWSGSQGSYEGTLRPTGAGGGGVT
jgi:hypothetical protein